MGMYDCTAGRFNAVAAAFLLCLQDSSHGDVPMVKPCEVDTTLWKVYNSGREIKEDWLLIHNSFTDSKVFAKTIRCKDINARVKDYSRTTYPIAQPHLKDWAIFLHPRASNSCVTIAQLQ